MSCYGHRLLTIIKSNNHWREIVPQIAYVKCKDFVTPTHDFGVSLFSYYHCQGFFSPNTFGITPMGMFCWMSHEGLNTKSNGNVFVECQEMLSTKIDWNDVLNVTGNVFVECHRKYIGWMSGNAFLAHLAKGKVSFCHHLASVVR